MKKIAMTFKQKDALIKKIGMDYKKNNFYKNCSMVIRESENNYMDNSEAYYNQIKLKVDYILLQLDDQLSRIIFNEYLTSKVYNWWIYYYSKSTYYRLKNKAMNGFLEWWNA